MDLHGLLHKYIHKVQFVICYLAEYADEHVNNKQFVDFWSAEPRTAMRHSDCRDAQYGLK
jgi:hypothetical protein